MSGAEKLRILFIEDNVGDCDLIKEMLSEAREISFEVVCPALLSEGLKHLEDGKWDAILLDLTLPDSTGLDSLNKLKVKAPEIPIIVLTGLHDEMLAVKAVQEGAQDYLVKGQVDVNLLVRSIRYAIERKQVELVLQKAHDELEKQVKQRTAELVKEIEERKWTEEALRESEKTLRYLTSQFLTAQEREKRRVSRELHDELGQALALLKLRLRFIEKNLQEDQTILKKECEDNLQYIDQVIEDVRRLSRDLSPSILEDLGLSAALHWLINNLMKNYLIEISLDVEDINHLFSQDAQIIIYRIFQEALTNIGKHAQATKVSVVMKEHHLNERQESLEGLLPFS
jgi:signal transduction histidine kinase